MAEHYAVVVEGLESLDAFENLPKRTIAAARIAINHAARKGYADAGRRIIQEVNFPARYVTGKAGRLQISQFATDKHLEAVITGRTRPTSLARFVTGSISIGGANRKAGVQVEVEPGSAKRLPGAFLIRLRAGSEANLDTKSNLGLAVRTKDGRPPPGYKPLPLGKNLWLLYGPSVSQILYSERNRGGVATDIQPKTMQILEDEFWRQMDLNS